MIVVDRKIFKSARGGSRISIPTVIGSSDGRQEDRSQPQKIVSDLVVVLLVVVLLVFWVLARCPRQASRGPKTLARPDPTE